MSRLRVAAVVQARMSSTRLPGKVLADFGGRPVLEFLLARLGRAKEIDEVVVATSVESSDDPIARLASGLGMEVVRGPLADVLERYRLAAEATGADAVARITGDCPFIDPELVDAVVALWRSGRHDLAANCVEPLSFPAGVEVEVMARGALDQAARESADPVEREHVTPYLRRHSERFSIGQVVLEPPCAHLRFDLDTPEDLERLRGLLDLLGPEARLGDLLAAEGCPPGVWRTG